jgi:miniconductance mechanosensitive channel
MIDQFEIILENWFTHLGMSEAIINFMRTFVFVIIIAFLSWIGYFITKQVLIATITRLIKKSKNNWDDILLQQNIFKRISHFVPAIIIYFTTELAFKGYPQAVSFFNSACYIYMIIMGLMVLNALISSIDTIYNTFSFAKSRPIKGYIQVISIFLYFIAFILILSVLLGKSPVYFLTGLGALAAVLLLVFKDTILGFVASIQLSANNMVKIGDWISMPSHNTDGTILEITLNTVKVQNWDKTIATVPTYALVAESFHNWRGMEDSGGRRIKRSINIDMKSIKFCTNEMLNKFKKIQHLTEYISTKENELKQYNAENNIDETIVVNGRRQTNIGVFRAYIENYLKSLPVIHNEMTFLVRQLQPNEKGLPLEIYVFSRVQEWADYEAIQSDILDHILAVIKEFELDVFQNPTGNDFQKIVN